MHVINIVCLLTDWGVQDRCVKLTPSIVLIRNVIGICLSMLIAFVWLGCIGKWQRYSRVHRPRITVRFT